MLQERYRLISFCVFFLHAWNALTQGCVDTCLTRKSSFEECDNMILMLNDSSSDDLNLTFLTTQYNTNHSEIQETTIINYISHVLAILCNKEKLTLLETDTISPLCYTIENIQDTIVCPSNCDNNTCFQVTIRTFYTMSAEIVSASSIKSILEEEGSLTALHLAGVPLLEAVSSTSGAGESVASVPLVSWVFVGLGVLVSFVTLIKPLWWDRCLKRVSVKKYKRDNRTSNDKELSENTR